VADDLLNDETALAFGLVTGTLDRHACGSVKSQKGTRSAAASDSAPDVAGVHVHDRRSMRSPTRLAPTAARRRCWTCRRRRRGPAAAPGPAAARGPHRCWTWETLQRRQRRARAAPSRAAPQAPARCARLCMRCWPMRDYRVQHVMGFDPSSRRLRASLSSSMTLRWCAQLT